MSQNHLSDDANTKSLVFTDENTQVVNDLIKATDDINAILRQINEYFLSLRRYFEDTKPFFNGSPSDEERNVMKERWSGFSVTTNQIREILPTIYTDIMMEPDIEAIKQFSRWSKHTPGAASEPERPTDSTARKAIGDAEHSAAAPVGTSASSEPTTSLWYKWWKRIISCLSLRHFR